MQEGPTILVRLPAPVPDRFSGTWQPDAREREAAWELFIEIAARMSPEEPPFDEAALQEAHGSLSAVSATTGEILRRYGPTVAQAKGEGNLSLGLISIAVVSSVLRPGLAQWQTLLKDFSSTRGGGTAGIELGKDLRRTVGVIHKVLLVYIDVVAQAAGVSEIHQALFQVATDAPVTSTEEEAEQPAAAPKAPEPVAPVAEEPPPAPETPRITLKAPVQPEPEPSTGESFADRFQRLRYQS